MSVMRWHKTSFRFRLIPDRRTAHVNTHATVRNTIECPSPSDTHTHVHVNVHQKHANATTGLVYLLLDFINVYTYIENARKHIIADNDNRADRHYGSEVEKIIIMKNDYQLSYITQLYRALVKTQCLDCDYNIVYRHQHLFTYTHSHTHVLLCTIIITIITYKYG